MALEFPVVSKAQHVKDPLEFIADSEGCFVLLDKPYGESSFFVVNELRKRISRRTGEKWVKVGHAGTLDPLATGLLIIAVRKATRALDPLLGLDKTYLSTIRFGVQSPSYDLETPITVVDNDPVVSEEALKHYLSSMIGVQDQLPPVFSALKQNGKAIYHHARQGVAVEVQPRKIEVHDTSLEELAMPFATFRLHCSKGTYVRSFVHDLGLHFTCGAVLTDLRREAIGSWRVEDALTLTELFAQPLSISTSSITA